MITLSLGNEEVYGLVFDEYEYEASAFPNGTTITLNYRYFGDQDIDKLRTAVHSKETEIVDNFIRDNSFHVTFGNGDKKKIVITDFEYVQTDYVSGRVRMEAVIVD